MIESRDIKLLGYENYGDDFNKSKDYLAGIPFANTQMDRMPRRSSRDGAR